MRVYIAGPINGYHDGNREAFLRRARELTAAGYEPVNPHDIPADHPGSPCVGPPLADRPDDPHHYGCYLRADIAVLLTCDGISLLPFWGSSVGASTEEHVARSIGLPWIL